MPLSRSGSVPKRTLLQMFFIAVDGPSLMPQLLWRTYFPPLCLLSGLLPGMSGDAVVTQERRRCRRAVPALQHLCASEVCGLASGFERTSSKVPLT